MVRNSGIWYSKLKLDGVLVFVFVVFNFVNTLMGLRPLKEMDGSIHEQHSIGGDDESEFGPFSSWNITGTYKGRWSFMDSDNRSNVLLELGKSHGLASFELVSSPTKITGVHYIHGLLIFGDMSDSECDRGDIRLRVEGVYIWPFRQLRLVASSGTEVEPLDDELFPPNPYHILGAFSSQLLQSSPQHRSRLGQNSLLDDIGKHCNLQVAAQFSRISSNEIDGDHSSLRMDGVVESPSLDEDGDCFLPIALNATSVNIGVYYSKAVNYTLMVTFVSFLQVLMLIRQMEHSNTQSGAAKVSLLMIGQQAIIDAYLCLLHLTAGILIESLFNAFATAAFFKFVVFAIFEMRYLLAIWKASRASNPNDGWETMRRDLSTLYSRFYGILLGGIIFMYELHSIIRPVLFLLYSFWIPQIVSNVIRDTRKPLHPYYVLGISISRLAVPLYIFGCPNNFLRIETDMIWCYCLVAFVGIQAFILILQHYLGSRCFIPRQILPEKYDYHIRIEQGASPAVDCVICMTPIDFMQRSNDSMVTPCDHFFHSGCLQRWMDIKMECPTCRRPLPPA